VRPGRVVVLAEFSEQPIQMAVIDRLDMEIGVRVKINI
jgi:hypothetical protein